jgi:hypothetical protein
VSRSRSFKNAEEMKQRIYDYFKWASDNSKTLTIGRLALYLGMGREEVVNYSGEGKYAENLNYAKDVILADMEERLASGNGSTNGITFLIKNNFGYKDKKDVDHTGHITHEAFMNKMLEKAETIDV